MALDPMEVFTAAIAESKVVEEIAANIKALPTGPKTFADYLGVVGVTSGPLKGLADLVDAAKKIDAGATMKFVDYLALAGITSGPMFDQAVAIDQLLADIKD